MEVHGILTREICYIILMIYPSKLNKLKKLHPSRERTDFHLELFRAVGTHIIPNLELNFLNNFEQLRTIAKWNAVLCGLG